MAVASETCLLVDFENLQPPAADLARIRGAGYRLWVFHGPHQNKFDAEMVKAWQPLGERVRFVQSSKRGKNALDFHIAFCLGQAQQEDASAARTARYVVVSKDGGFDPLFDYMRSLGCAVQRAASIPDALAMAKREEPPFPAAGGKFPVAATGPTRDVAIEPRPAAKPAAKKVAKKPSAKLASQPKSVSKSTNADGPLHKVIAYLQGHPNDRPTTKNKLENHVPSMVGGKVTKERTAELMSKLEHTGLVKITGQKIEYKIPKSKK